MRRKLGLAIAAIRELGFAPVSLYALYEAQRRLGWLRIKTPILEWDSFNLNRVALEGIPTDPQAYFDYRTQLSTKFLFDPEDDISALLEMVLGDAASNLLRKADGILEGHFPFFSRELQNLGYPPSWNSFPILSTTEEVPGEILDMHWAQIDIEALPADIKTLWELSRFSWVYTLGRAYRLTGDRKYASGFLDLLQDWRQKNPPNHGPQWISAQEAAIRLIALVFGQYVFFPVLKEQPRSLLTVTEIIAAHAERIQATLLYSRAQGNNHLLVEAVGLYSVGLLFPELKQSSQWYRIGRKWILSAISNQVFTDGGYIQHSTNYQRLALQAMLWAVRLGELNDDVFPETTLNSVRKMAICLGAFVDFDTGQASNFGSNDGAMLLPLSTCTFQDYRPILQAANQLLFKNNIFPPGPWDEEGLWFGYQGVSNDKFAKSSEESVLDWETHTKAIRMDDHIKGGQSFPETGVYLLGGGETWGFLRCAHFEDRPGQSDQLHLDIWWRGENIARDPGTYLYNGDDPWENGLATLKVHNTIVVDELEPMDRAGRFLWLDWSKGELLSRNRSKDGQLEYVSAQYLGYETLGVRCVRHIIRAKDHQWMTIDEVVGSGYHKLRSGWLLPDTDWTLDGVSLKVDHSVGRFRVEFHGQEIQLGLYRSGECIQGKNVADCEEILGWYSPTYTYKEAGLYLAAAIEGELPLCLMSRWCLGDEERNEILIEWKESREGPRRINTIIYGDEVLER
jgi:asparagine synthase (glutamine-hydrolysing)